MLLPIFTPIAEHAIGSKKMIATNGSCPHKDDLSDTIAPLTGVPKSYSFERKPFDIGSRRHFNTTITRALHARLLH